MDGLTAGRIVHYVLSENEHRPAIIVKVWTVTGTVNLQVFTDGGNDSWLADNVAWRTSVRYSEDKEIGTWHWIEPA